MLVEPNPGRDGGVVKKALVEATPTCLLVDSFVYFCASLSEPVSFHLDLSLESNCGFNADAASTVLDSDFSVLLTLSNGDLKISLVVCVPKLANGDSVVLVLPEISANCVLLTCEPKILPVLVEPELNGELVLFPVRSSPRSFLESAKISVSVFKLLNVNEVDPNAGVPNFGVPNAGLPNDEAVSDFPNGAAVLELLKATDPKLELPNAESSGLLSVLFWGKATSGTEFDLFGSC
ncbi:hypothetical protein WICMUC_001149 [Wickerhamomyces mucosus]|uniref:Uncharacterized protein n=1 Tax=Wickerhamomyces mucosus TaxID=1378264 RepID=A0A9P8PVE6_9ASCO|nr:hypothetical protein WICMUC_001149 [Wickerhamomyces mucosus]